MDEIELLASVMDKTGDVIAAVGPDQLDRPTPCPDFDVEALVNHIVGWAQAFEAGARRRTFAGNPADYRAGADHDPAGDFRAAAAGMVAAWRDEGIDRKVLMASGGGETDGEMAFNMTLMEYLTHGWDLAVATGQAVPYTEAEAEAVLARAQVTLPPEYRGESMPFGHIVPVGDDSPAVDRLVAFLGRQPRP
jgi:uncharacterized protein (TIGR03086 family)